MLRTKEGPDSFPSAICFGRWIRETALKDLLDLHTARIDAWQLTGGILSILELLDLNYSFWVLCKKRSITW